MDLNKIDKNTFSSYLALCGCIIQPSDNFVCTDIESVENKLYNLHTSKLKPKIDVSRLEPICSRKTEGTRTLYYGNVVAAYKMMTILSYQEDIDVVNFNTKNTTDSL